jgi:hypothetical protein
MWIETPLRRARPAVAVLALALLGRGGLQWLTEATWIEMPGSCRGAGCSPGCSGLLRPRGLKCLIVDLLRLIVVKL